MSFRVQQLDVRVETKSLDNVFMHVTGKRNIGLVWSSHDVSSRNVLTTWFCATSTLVVSVQYQILREKTYEAFYALTNPAQQITAHVCT